MDQLLEMSNNKEKKWPRDLSIRERGVESPNLAKRQSSSGSASLISW